MIVWRYKNEHYQKCSMVCLAVKLIGTALVWINQRSYSTPAEVSIGMGDRVRGSTPGVRKSLSVGSPHFVCIRASFCVFSLWFLRVFVNASAIDCFKILVWKTRFRRDLLCIEYDATQSLIQWPIQYLGPGHPHYQPHFKGEGFHNTRRYLLYWGPSNFIYSLHYNLLSLL